MTRTAFVTGGTGFLGGHLLPLLARENWHAVALRRRGATTEHLSGLAVDWVEGDVTDLVSVREAMPDAPDAVVHLAADLSHWSRNDARQTRVNVEGTRNVTDVALEKAARRFVHVSSIGAWGLRTGVIDEGTPQLGARSPVNYHRTKHAAEAIVREAVARGLPAVIVNPASVMGPGDRHGWARLIRLVSAEKLPGVPDGRSSFCDVREVAKAIMRAAEVGRVGENYLLGGADASYLDLVRMIGAVTGKAAPARTTPGWLLGAAAQVLDFVSRLTGREPRFTPEGVALVRRRQRIVCAKAQAELGFRPVPLRTLVEDSYRWLAENDGLAT